MAVIIKITIFLYVMQYVYSLEDIYTTFWRNLYQLEDGGNKFLQNTVQLW
jgi:hypothetical protein